MTFSEKDLDHIANFPIERMSPDDLRKMLRYEIRTGSPDMLRRMAYAVSDREGRRLRGEQMARARRESLDREIAAALLAEPDLTPQQRADLADLLRDGQ